LGPGGTWRDLTRSIIVACQRQGQASAGGGQRQEIRKQERGRGSLRRLSPGGAFDRLHQRPTHRRIMARAGWKSFAHVPHNLVVTSVAAVNPGAVVKVSGSGHDFLLRQRVLLTAAASAERGVPREARSLRGYGFVHAASEDSLISHETEHYFRFEDTRDGYQWGRTSRKKIRAVTGPIFLNSCSFTESSLGVFACARRLVTVP
jgi:hypothetical protein